MVFTRLLLSILFTLLFSLQEISGERQNIEDLMEFIDLNIKNENNPDALISLQNLEDLSESRMDNLRVLINRMDKILSFIELNFKNINLDGLFGIRIGEGIIFNNNIMILYKLSFV
jgi:hypothetical protein